VVDCPRQNQEKVKEADSHHHILDKHILCYRKLLLWTIKDWQEM